MLDSTRPSKFRVLVVGGGVAGLEAVLALRQLTTDDVEVTVLSAAEEFVMRPMAVREPFAYSGGRRHQVAPILRDLGVGLIRDNLASVDQAAKSVTTTRGQRFEYDALLIACGARPAVRYEHAVTIDDRKIDELLHGMIQDIEGDYIHSVAFLAPPRMGWPLPLYELAMMTAHRAWDMGITLATTIVTPEDRPLEAFGAAASDGVAELLARAGITLMPSAHAEVPHRREIVINPGNRRLAVDRVIALPELFGPAIDGLPQDDHGFLPIDEFSRVIGADSVYAAGDASNYPIKHGGLASQMADVAARSIAALAGGPLEPKPLEPILRGMLLTGTAPRYLSARRSGGHAFDSTFSMSPTWDPPSKISSRYLAPYLEEREKSGATAPR